MTRRIIYIVLGLLPLLIVVAVVSYQSKYQPTPELQVAYKALSLSALGIWVALFILFITQLINETRLKRIEDKIDALLRQSENQRVQDSLGYSISRLTGGVLGILNYFTKQRKGEPK